jgi:molybdopterin/thiamine biosynthesis adenylyltransferase
VPEAGFSVAERYARHLVLPEIGGAGQQRLSAARVAIVGMGGLGNPAAQYLAAAGIGQLRLIDNDTVSASNLQRQVLFTEADPGRPKVEAAAERLHALNAACRIEARRERLTHENAQSLLAGHDVVIDATDRLEARYAINDACLALGLPWIMGAVIRFEGQLSVFDARDPAAPCYRCLYPEPPPAGALPACAEAGVVGAAAGLIGTWQALEAIKLLTGAGEPLVGWLLLFDGLSGQVDRVALKARPGCEHGGEAIPQQNSA